MDQGPVPEAAGELSLLARAGAHLCAIPLGAVAEVMRALPIHHLAGAPPFIAGLAVVRGAPVPVVDLAALLEGDRARAAAAVTAGAPPAGTAGDAGRMFVTVRVARPGAREQVVALLVAAVSGMRALDPAQRAASPPLVERLDGELIAAVSRLDSSLVLVLRAARLVPEPAWGALDAATTTAAAAASAGAAPGAGTPVARPAGPPR